MRNVVLSLIVGCLSVPALQADEKSQHAHQIGMKIVVYQLKHIPAHEAAAKLKENLGDDAETSISIVPDKKTNTLLVSTTAELADLAHWHVLWSDMEEYWIRFPRQPSPVHDCIMIDDKHFTESFDLSEEINGWLNRSPHTQLEVHEIEVTKKLGSRISIEPRRCSLLEFIEDVRATTDVPIVFYLNDLKDVGLTPDSVIDVSIQGAYLSNALDRVLTPLNLAYHIKEDVVKVTSARRVNGTIITRVYPVPDLVARVKHGKAVIDFDNVANRIRKAVLPDSWKVNGGKSSITKCEASLSLVIRQSRQGHLEIRKFFDELRKRRTGKIRPSR